MSVNYSELFQTAGITPTNNIDSGMTVDMSSCMKWIIKYMKFQFEKINPLN